jgi:L-malate glycosyltransferase
MRVLFFNYEYPPLGGGAGNATRYILNEFSKIKDLEVDLVTSAIDKKYAVEKIAENITIYKVPIGKNSTNLHYQTQKEIIIYTWKAFWLANKLTKSNKYDLTHSFFGVPCGSVSLWLKLTKKIPYIISLRGSDVPGYSERFAWLYRILTPLIKYIWKEAKFVVANSLEFKKLALITNNKQKIEIITNGIDIDEFFAKKIENRTDERLGDFKIICCARIIARKGINFIIEALGILKDRGINLKLEIIGEGNQKEELKELTRNLKLEEEVSFLGLIKHSELPNFYTQANVSVSASLNEGMSNTMLESLACGLPIIATKTGGTDEIVREGINGFVVKMNSAQDIADKLEILFKDYSLEKRMSQASRELALRMSWKNIAKEYSNLYKEISG